MNKILKKIMVLTLSLMMLLSVAINPQAIDNSRADLGILDSLKMTNQWGGVIDENTVGAEVRVGDVYTLRYEWSLDDPTSDYRNKVATFKLPTIFDATTISPTNIPINYDDAGTPVEIGRATINADGTVSIQFNSNPILGNKSNISGWLSLSAKVGSTLGSKDVVVGWDGNNEDKISVTVKGQGDGDKYPTRINKYVKSGSTGGQPIVKKDANGKFFVSFSVELLLSQSYPELTFTDTVYAGMEVDPNTIQVISRPRDGTAYYIVEPPINTYKQGYDLWKAQNPTGPLSVFFDATANLKNSNAITASGTGFEIKLGNTDFNRELASRQLTTVPLQMRYIVNYNVFLTGIDPQATLEQAQTMFESQTAKNHVSLSSNETFVEEATWLKGTIGGGAEGETRGVTLKKIDAQTKQALSGAAFNLYKQNAYNAALWELYKADINMTTAETIVSGLTFGTYRFEETKAPDGYVLSPTPFAEFKIDANTPLTNFEITLENSKALGALEFEKVDATDSAIKLKATFEVHKKSNDALVTTVTTGTDGKCSVPDLELGDYYLLETDAPDNYALDTTKYEFTITAGDTNKIYVGNNAIKNAKDVGQLEVLKVGPNQEKLAGAEFDVKDSTGAIIEHITSGDDGIAKTTVDLAPGVYTLLETKAPTGYVLDTTPKTITIVEGATAAVHLDFVNVKDVGQLEVLKVGPNQEKLAGAEFDVKDSTNAIVEHIVSGADGIAKTTVDLIPGEYTLVETKAPTGYVLDTTPKTVTIVEGTTAAVHLDFVNVKDVGQLEVLKVGPDQEKLAGAEFDVKDSTDAIVEHIVSGANGIAKTTVDLEPGEYTLVETKAPVGFVLDATPRTVTIVEGATAAVHLDFANVKDIGQLEVLKVGPNQEKLAGAEFDVRDILGLVIEHITTGTDGIAKTTVDLMPGIYTLVETKAPEGFVLDETPRTVTIVEGATTAVHLDFVNVKDIGQLEVLKVGPNQETLAGAEFDVKDSTDAVIEHITSGSDGIAKTTVDLMPGEYTLVETKAPTGYVLDTTPRTVTIVDGATAVVHLDFVNVKDVGALEVLKLGPNQEALAGAEFDIKDSSDAVIEHITSGSDGIAKTTVDLEPGEYTLVETKAPEGYVLDATPRTVTIVEGATSAVHLDFLNGEDVGQLEVLKVGPNQGALAGAEFDVKDSTDAIVEHIVSGADGIAKTTVDLEPGEYTLVETKAPEGYVLDTTPRTVTVVEGATAALHLDFVNFKDVGQLEVLKAGPNQEVLEGAEFDVKDSTDTVVEHITSGADGIAKTTVDLEPGEYTLIETKAPTGYVLDATPRTVTILEGATEAVYLEFENAKDVGQLEVLKVGPNQEKLAGAEFDVKDSTDTVVEHIISGADGLAKTTIDLEPGEYTLIETKAPEGFVLDTTSRTVTIVDGATAAVHLDFENVKDVGQLEVLKVGPNQEALAGAEFDVKDSTDAVIEHIISGADGIAKTTIDLVPGEYTLIETKAPTGYVLDTTPRAVTVVEGAREAVHLDFVNVKDVGALEVLKIGPNHEALARAEFDVKDSTGTIVDHITSGSDGLAKTTVDLAPGVYTLVETRAPEGYVLDPTEHTLTVVEGATAEVHLDFENAKDVGQLEVLKVGPNQEKLAGAEFDVKDSEGTIVEKIISGTDGLAKTTLDLVPGEYTLVETKAPTGYVLDTTPKTVTIVEGATSAVHLDFENVKAVGALGFEKVDSADSTIKLDATFEIHKKSDDALVSTVTTGTDGKCLVSNLELGAYYLVEIEAPDHYVLDATKYEFTIMEGMTNTVYVGDKAIKNTKEVEPKKPIPKTGDDENLPGLSMAILGASLLLILIRKKKIKE